MRWTGIDGKLETKDSEARNTEYSYSSPTKQRGTHGIEIRRKMGVISVVALHHDRHVTVAHQDKNSRGTFIAARLKCSSFQAVRLID